jgi:hypothetical protein
MQHVLTDVIASICHFSDWMRTWTFCFGGERNDGLLSQEYFECREELEKQKAHERYLKLQEQGKTEQSKKDLGQCCSYLF